MVLGAGISAIFKGVGAVTPSMLQTGPFRLIKRAAGWGLAGTSAVTMAADGVYNAFDGAPTDENGSPILDESGNPVEDSFEIPVTSSVFGFMWDKGTDAVSWGWNKAWGDEPATKQLSNTVSDVGNTIKAVADQDNPTTALSVFEKNADLFGLGGGGLLGLISAGLLSNFPILATVVAVGTTAAGYIYGDDMAKTLSNAFNGVKLPESVRNFDVAGAAKDTGSFIQRQISGDPNTLRLDGNRYVPEPLTLG